MPHHWLDDVGDNRLKLWKKLSWYFNRGIDTMEITALSNHKPGIVNNYIKIDIKSVRSISYWVFCPMSNGVGFLVCLYLYCRWNSNCQDDINWLNAATFLCLSQTSTLISLGICRDLFLCSMVWGRATISILKNYINKLWKNKCHTVVGTVLKSKEKSLKIANSIPNSHI